MRARRFFYDVEARAQRRIFAKRFEAVEPQVKRTSRLDDFVRYLAIAR
jgi:hypothetical protein